MYGPPLGKGLSSMCGECPTKTGRLFLVGNGDHAQVHSTDKIKKEPSFRRIVMLPLRMLMPPRLSKKERPVASISPQSSGGPLSF
ncbi:hypothetical protein SuNHUV7_41540 (plasmid) [Pseudoseohaeicola sp. NH-UV-7]